jgi:peptide/nickel transport system permease protein
VTRVIFNRLMLTAPLVGGVLTLVFILVQTAPGDPQHLLLGMGPVPPEVRERVEEAYGLDQPPLTRYGRWLSALVLRGELGWSHSRGKPVALLLRETIPPTALLAGTALLVNVVVGLLLGLLSAARPGGRTDRALTVGSLTLYAMPTFWLALMSVLCLSYLVPLFPAASLQSVGAEDWPLWRRVADRAWHLALPALVLGLASAAAMMRFVRAGLLQVLAREFIRAARARGLGGGRVLIVHALRNALLPVINLVGLSLPVLLSGSLVVEVVFAWPGMGRLTYEAIRADDLSVVLATTMLATLSVVLGNLAADLAMAAVDPRIRLGASAGRS